MSNTHGLADNLGADEPQAIHLGVRDLALRTQPQYEADDGPLTVAQMRQIKQRAPQDKKRWVRSGLFNFKASRP
jgi:hypothetical protein